MSIFEYDDIKKTRRSIIIVASLMIAAPIYMASNQDIVIFGLKLHVTSESIITSLSFLILYLWIMLIVHAVREFFPKHFESRNQALDDGENRAHDSLIPPTEEDDHGQWNDHREIEEFYKTKRKAIRYYSNVTYFGSKIVGEILPPLLISIYVLLKFDVLNRVFFAMRNALTNL